MANLQKMEQLMISNKHDAKNYINFKSIITFMSYALSLPATPPSKGSSPIDLGSASCNPVI